MSFFTTDEFSVRITKITSRIGVMNSQPAFLFLTYFNSMKIMAVIRKDENKITLNHITFANLALQKLEALLRILLIVNLFLNRTLGTFLLYVRLWFSQSCSFLFVSFDANICSIMAFPS